MEPGQVLGLVGRTGSGKTTLARLALRLYDPTQGEVCLGGVALPGLKLATLRRHIGVVTQEVQLFQASVRDNLTFFNPAISDDHLGSVLADLDLTSWLNDLPDGLDTILQAGGSNLSAGQAQLLAFGRAFLTHPGLIILDEASSRLDPATERRIERAIDKLLYAPRRTGIIIAHRLTTLQRVDQILILKDGRILEYGPRAQLAADPDSHFSQLLQTGLSVDEAAEAILV
jgi:ABC-type multidrug transport system fused ATPase/permease subunit